MPTILSFGSEDDDLYKVAVKANIRVILLKKKWWSKNLDTFDVLKKFDVLHLHSPIILKVILLLIPALTHRKLIYTRHGEGQYDTISWKVVHILARPFISATTYVSTNGQNVFNKVHGWKNTPQKVIENGINIPNDIIVDNEPTVLRIGSVGRMVPLKSQKDLILAWANLPIKIRSKVEIHLIGDGVCREILEQQVVNLNAQMSIFFHGFLSDRFDILSLFDLLVVSSESEGLSIAILEAMAHAKPVIATRVGGNPQLVKDDLTGYLYEYGDIKKLSNTILTYYQNMEVLERHGNNAKKHVQDNYSLEKTARSIIIFTICKHKVQLIVNLIFSISFLFCIYLNTAGAETLAFELTPINKITNDSKTSWTIPIPNYLVDKRSNIQLFDESNTLIKANYSIVLLWPNKQERRYIRSLYISVDSPSPKTFYTLQWENEYNSNIQTKNEIANVTHHAILSSNWLSLSHYAPMLTPPKTH
ncbi:glycosyltransferase family 4 protein [Colwellia sp. MSW7]|uniref:Glycosyltransferase family 4 protein n=2 Tax=Colwellia maritima TaxID=2912588 RepID=A0ABS9WWS4_9GAMM|nr:glycosyltransferase family 4 protein [Colwellia maritima]